MQAEEDLAVNTEEGLAMEKGGNEERSGKLHNRWQEGKFYEVGDLTASESTFLVAVKNEPGGSRFS